MPVLLLNLLTKNVIYLFKSFFISLLILYMLQPIYEKKFPL